VEESKGEKEVVQPRCGGPPGKFQVRGKLVSDVAAQVRSLEAEMNALIDKEPVNGNLKEAVERVAFSGNEEEREQVLEAVKAVRRYCVVAKRYYKHCLTVPDREKLQQLKKLTTSANAWFNLLWRLSGGAKRQELKLKARELQHRLLTGGMSQRHYERKMRKVYKEYEKLRQRG
jgi:hypothetical protein